MCFGSNETTCPDDNLYRIIGVFNNQVKLIKATSYGNYAWEQDNIDQRNTWDETTKPDIYATLNTTYYNTLGSEWQNLIAETIWQVGGMVRNTTNTVKQYYDVEVGTGQSGYEETMKIGLMYVSDYGYSANLEKWTTALFGTDYGIDNWLYSGNKEWTISRNSNDKSFVFFVYSDWGIGDVSAAAYATSNSFVIRPTFYLNSDVQYISGIGSQSNPFRIA